MSEEIIESMEAIPDPVANLEGMDAELGLQTAIELGLTQGEYEHVCKIQGRTPTITELYIYSLMWSEHCSYKHSKLQLKKFSSEGEYVLQGPGENAGVISVGDGWAVAFKMESHNHPSAIEPFQGAATGVGGIIRDIFTMGARPIASMDSLRFGTLDKPRPRYLFDGAVGGVSSYGNCLGIPTVGGDVFFDEAYEGNCLIDVVGVGLLREEELTRAVGSGPGNHVVLIGSSTGRDGIGGASTLASQEFDEAAENKRPAVQVGDPLEEKLLIEVCLELLKAGKFVALGDLGAAGLTSSASEMASRGGVGIDIDVRKVIQREENMQPFEIMVSESQERMLAVVTPENLPDVAECCDRWGVAYAPIGKITDTGRFVVRDTDLPEDEQIVADMPAEKLAQDAPVYAPAMERPAYLDEVAAFDISSLDLPEGEEELQQAYMDMIASANICSRKWIWQQYDHQVQGNTVVLPGADAAVVRIGDTGRGEMTNRGIALTTDCNGLYCYLDPYAGAQGAIVEATRNLACVGAKPAAVTDCLNFGNPEKPEVFWTFSTAIDGLSDACKRFRIPVISGNVSFYNESFGNAIFPTPNIGMVGIIDDLDKIMTPSFKDEGDVIILLGETLDELGGSEFLRSRYGLATGKPPVVDLELEADLDAMLLECIANKTIKSAHDCSEGGVAVALTESALAGNIGFNVDLDDDLSGCASLFSETQSRVVISAAEENVDDIVDMAQARGVPLSVIGTVGGDRIEIAGKVSAALSDVKTIYDETLEQLVTAR